MVSLKTAAPGRMVGNLHLHQTGAGVPAVVLEAGIAASSVSWSLVAPLLAKHTTVLAYDRAGFGWSGPMNGSDAVEELESLLAASGVAGPYVLAGHSFGGLLVRLFQQKRPDLVAGLVLVDPVVRGEWHPLSGQRARMLRRGAMLSRRGAALARVGVVRGALWMLLNGSQRLPKLIAKASAGQGESVTHRLVGEVRKLPRELWPAMAGHWSRAHTFEAMARNLETLPATIQRLDETQGLGELPTTILTAATTPEHGAQEHARDAGLSTRGRHVRVPDSTHWMMLDTPQVVAGAILDVLRRR
jgi:pimeloyl-ACP methyl ester carboxylesterase